MAIVAAFEAATKRALAAGFRCDRDPRGPRLPAARVPVPAEQPADGRLRREPGEPDAAATPRCRGVRKLVPAELPVFVRISATDWADGGWDGEQSVVLARRLKELGIDLIDVSSGGLVPKARIPVGKGYQVPFARKIRDETGVMTGAVGLITEAEHANEIVTGGDADLVLLARELLREPYWASKRSRNSAPKRPGPSRTATRSSGGRSRTRRVPPCVLALAAASQGGVAGGVAVDRLCLRSPATGSEISALDGCFTGTSARQEYRRHGNPGRRRGPTAATAAAAPPGRYSRGNTSRCPRITRVEAPSEGPRGFVTSPAGYSAVYQSAHHSYTLPCISCNPRALAG